MTAANKSTPGTSFTEALDIEGAVAQAVLTEGRPRIIAQIESYATSILYAFLSGNEAGNAIAAILVGK